MQFLPQLWRRRVDLVLVVRVGVLAPLRGALEALLSTFHINTVGN